MKPDRLKTIAFGCMVLLMSVLVSATFIEKIYGTGFAISNIYHSWWFIALWALLAVSASIYLLQFSKRRTLVLLHLSLVLVLLGASVSFATSRRGEITLSKNAVPASMFTTLTGNLEKLPFKLQLQNADACYTGNDIHTDNYTAYIGISSKESNIEIHTVSLNNPINIKGYSFCIKSIHDGKLSLIVTYDPWGTTISYAGYLLTIISFIMLFVDKRSGAYQLMTNRKFRVTYKSLFIAIGVIILVTSRINTFTGEDSQPILHTPLLAIHISTIIVAYSLIGCIAFNSLFALLNKNDETRMERASIRGRMLLYPTTILMATGIFIGAFWANISWGRYWGWDPKEVWALLTLFLCSLPLHTRSLPFMTKPLIFHIYCIAIFMVMLFTYFGVNYLLSGLHSYA